MSNKACNYLNSFLLHSRMSKFTRNKVSYNVDEALDYLLESNEKDLGQLEDDNGGDSSIDSEYNDDNDYLVSIANNVFISGSGQDAEQVKFVVGRKTKTQKKHWSYNAP